MTPLTIKTATASDEAPAIDVVVLAVSADPAARWAYPDPQQYLGQRIRRSVTPACTSPV
jgi:hypothetical protein